MFMASPLVLVDADTLGTVRTPRGKEGKRYGFAQSAIASLFTATSTFVFAFLIARLFMTVEVLIEPWLWSTMCCVYWWSNATIGLPHRSVDIDLVWSVRRVVICAVCTMHIIRDITIISESWAAIEKVGVYSSKKIFMKLVALDF